MPAPPKDPSQRRRRNKEQPRRAASTALPPTSRRKAPAPPSWLEKRLHPAYRELWRSSVANLWPPSSAELVARLCVLRDHVNRTPIADVRPAMLGQVLQLERELLLATKAARASGVTVRDETAPADAELEQSAPAAKRATVSSSRRRRVDLRVVGGD